jgi:hypothetical protein
MAGSATAGAFEGSAETNHPRTPLHPRPIEATTLISLADRVRRLCPSHSDPEAFHLEKNEIEHALRRLAAQGAP